MTSKKRDLSEGSNSRNGEDRKKSEKIMIILIPCLMMFHRMAEALWAVQKSWLTA